MIVLGQAASPDTGRLQLFQNEIANTSQVLWVKLWALEGISNIKKDGRPFQRRRSRARSARTIAYFLDKQKELPWPVQMRGLEALGWLRQSGLPTDASKAHMANTAMQFLADTERQVRGPCGGRPRPGADAGERGTEVQFQAGGATTPGCSRRTWPPRSTSSSRTTRPGSENPTRAQYLTALLVGPVYQFFDGVQGESNSGLLQIGEGRHRVPEVHPEGLRAWSSRWRKPRSSCSVHRRRNSRTGKQKLAARVAELRTFLKQNPPPSRQLVESGREFGAEGEQAGAPASGPGATAGGQPVVDDKHPRHVRPTSCSRCRRSATITPSTPRSSGTSTPAVG